MEGLVPPRLSTQILTMSACRLAIASTAARASSALPAGRADQAQPGKRGARPGADTAVCRKHRRAIQFALPLLLHEWVQKVAVEPQRQHRGDAVALVLPQFREHVFRGVGRGRVLAIGDQCQMAVGIDQPRHHRIAVQIEDPRSGRQRAAAG
jgi:hypothetical protein